MVLAWTATGVEKFTCCQPDDPPPLKVAVASNAPDDDHRLPTWVPVSPAPL